MKKIGIIGGGISGLTLGCVLKGSGKECVIFERSSALSEHGAGISLTPNACKIPVSYTHLTLPTTVSV